jgi:Zn-finger nucleic acid-binding protein
MTEAIPSDWLSMKSPTGVAAFNCPNCGAAVAPDSVSCGYCGSAIASHLCAVCFGTISVGMKHCPHCGAEAVAAVKERSAQFRCPRCEIELDLISIGGYALNACSRCGGIWAGKSSFQSLCTREEAQEAVFGFQPEPSKTAAVSKERPQRTYVPCPECGKLMNRQNFSRCSGVVLDWCRNHGTWLDRGELQQIVAFIRDGGLRKARDRELLRLKEQEGHLRMQEFTIASLDRRLDSGLGGMVNSQESDSFLHFLDLLLK